MSMALVTIKKLLKYSVVFIILTTLYCGFTIVYPFVFARNASLIEIVDNSKIFIFSDGSQKPGLKVAVLGDSTALGQGTDSVEQSFSFQYIDKYIIPNYENIQYRNFAVSGVKTQSALESQLPKLIQFEPDLLFVSIGANDVTGLSGEKVFVEQFTKLADTIAKMKIKVVWMSIPDFITSPILLPPLRDYLSMTANKYNKLGKTIVVEQGFYYVDVFDSTRKEFLDKATLYFSIDKFHPSKDGYSLWVREINKTVGKLDFNV
jgi:lysophospholipase L1-like esterase